MLQGQNDELRREIRMLKAGYVVMSSSLPAGSGLPLPSTGAHRVVVPVTMRTPWTVTSTRRTLSVNGEGYAGNRQGTARPPIHRSRVVEACFSFSVSWTTMRIFSTYAFWISLCVFLDRVIVIFHRVHHSRWSSCLRSLPKFHCRAVQGQRPDEVGPVGVYTCIGTGVRMSQTPRRLHSRV